MTGLKVDGLYLELSGTSILENITITLSKGEIVGLVGPNGAGKSSLIKSILGLFEIKKGNISLESRDIEALSLKERAQKMAYAAQGAPVHWPLTTEHIIGLGRIPHLNPWQKMSNKDHGIVEHVMKQTDCAHLKGRSVTTLSGGERARVLLARTLAAQAPYIFADEPVASLDPAHQLQIMEILAEQAKAGHGVMVVMHDLNLAQRYCDQLILLNEGKLIGQGKPDTILSDENLANVFSVSASRWTEDGESYLVTHHKTESKAQ